MATNEELATRIQGGERELLPALWDGVQAFARLQAGRWLRAWKPCRPGLEFDDLYQCGWPAMCAACETFRADAGCKFLGWFRRYLLSEFTREIGIRSLKQSHDPINNCPASLDAPLGDDEDMTLSDVVPDPENRFDAVDEDIYMNQLHEELEDALSRLSQREQDIIRSIYYGGESARSVAARRHVAVATVCQARDHAFRAMRRTNGRALQEMLGETSSAYRGTGLSSWQQTGVSATERLVMKAESWEPDI